LHYARFNDTTEVLLKIQGLLAVTPSSIQKRLEYLDLNTLQVLNFDLDLLRCVLEMAHSKCSNCRPLPKNNATRTAQFMGTQQLVFTVPPLLHIASFTSHYDPKTRSLFQVAKYPTSLIEQTGSNLDIYNGYFNVFYSSRPPFECRDSNFRAKTTFSSVLSISLPITTLSNYLKLVTSADNTAVVNANLKSRQP
jgi:hypothetical protein